MRKISVLAVLAFVFSYASVPANAVVLGGLELGGQELNITLDIDDPRGAVSANGLVYVVGNEGGVGVRQIIDIANGTISAIETFTSLAGGANPRSSIFGVTVLNDGRVLYVGNAATLSVNNTPAYWLDPEIAVAAARFPSDAGNVEVATPSGLLAGSLNNPAAVGSLLQPMINLPGASGGTGIIDATIDDLYLVGTAGIYRQSGPNPLDYIKEDTSTWDAAPDSIAFPDTFVGTLKTATGYLFAGEFLDANTFSTRVGVWNEVGEFLGATHAGDAFADIGIFEGEVIIGVNGANGGALFALSDLSSVLLLSDIYGSAVTIVADSFFTGSLGLLVANSAGGMFATSFASAPSNTVPEPNTLALLVLSLPLLKRRIKEIRI